MNIYTDINKVFKVAADKLNVIYLPMQVFKRTDFSFLLTIGGDLADGNEEYQRLMSVLKDIGESEFYLLENAQVNLEKRIVPLQATISVNSSFDYFQEIIKTFDPPTGWTLNDWFVFGEDPNWGIYISECPTINVIGCDKKLAEKFKEIYNINKNGFGELKDFISREFQDRLDLINQFMINYKL